MQVEQRTAPAFAKANGIELCYDTFGDPKAPPMMLIMGLAAQMIAWDDEFCALLARHGLLRHALRQPRHRPVDPDRAGRACPNVQAAFMAAMQGKPIEAPPTC